MLVIPPLYLQEAPDLTDNQNLYILSDFATRSRLAKQGFATHGAVPSMELLYYLYTFRKLLI